MRFPLAALFFVVLGFIFLAFWGFGSMLLSETSDALDPYVTELAEPNLTSMIANLSTAFGIICAVFFVVGILLFFILDAFAEEPELYWRRY